MATVTELFDADGQRVQAIVIVCYEAVSSDIAQSSYFIEPRMDDENVYVVTGDSGSGMAHGTIAGILLTDLIMGRENEWATLYDPSRKTLRSAPDYIKEKLNVAGQYVEGFLPAAKSILSKS